MSVVAAKVFPDRIEIASDSILIKDDLKKTNFKKMLSTPTITVGGCGNAEELQLFFTFVSNNAPDDGTSKGVLDYMKQFANWKAQYTNDDTIKNCYLIITDHKLYEVDEMFVQKIDDYTAIGEGEPYALAALHLGHSVEAAVHTACDLCCFVAPPVSKYTVMKV